MTLPIKQNTWTISTNNRIPYTTLNAVMASFLFHAFGVAGFLPGAGYTVVGSCDGTTGALDGTNRWTGTTKTNTRGNGSSAAMSWIILADANGVQTCISYNGASDDVCRVAMSPTAAYVLAGTATFQPTATDEQIATASQSVIGSTTSGDRLWNGWYSSDNKCFRFILASGGVWIGSLFGVESVTSKVINGAVYTPAVWGFGCAVSFAAITNASAMGSARAVIASTPKTMPTFPGCETFVNIATTAPNKTELQGAVGFPMIPVIIGSNTAGAHGKIGNLVDWWVSNNALAHGTTSPGLEFIVTAGLASANTGQDGAMWPWDGASTPTLT